MAGMCTCPCCSIKSLPDTPCSLPLKCPSEELPSPAAPGPTTLYTGWADVVLSSKAGTPWYLASTTSHLSPFSHPSMLRQFQVKGGGRGQKSKHTAASSCLSSVTVGPSQQPYLWDLICRLPASHCLRCAGWDHCHTLPQALREHT